jgi:hypothetical protein
MISGVDKQELMGGARSVCPPQLRTFQTLCGACGARERASKSDKAAAGPTDAPAQQQFVYAAPPAYGVAGATAAVSPAAAGSPGKVPEQGVYGAKARAADRRSASTRPSAPDMPASLV